MPSTVLSLNAMKKRFAKPSGFTDREMYPTLLITIVALLAAAGVWFFAGKPTISVCWFYTEYHIYCPGCGCTRALIAMMRGQWAASLYYNPAVLLVSGLLTVYLGSQTIWRIRGRRGWVLHYADWWLPGLLILLAVNCILRNILWQGFGIPI